MILRRMADAIRKQDWTVVAIELVVVVVGILIGLQVDDWAERRKEAESFKEVLERVYTDLKKERYQFVRDFEELELQIRLAGQLLDDPGAIPDRKLVPKLFYLDLPRNWANPRPAGIAIQRQIELLAANANTPRQLLVAKHIVDYAAQDRANQDTPERHFVSSGQKDWTTPILRDAGITDPAMVWQMSSLNGFRGAGVVLDRTYSDEEIATVRELLSGVEMRRALESLLAKKNVLLNFYYNQREAADSAIDRIRDEYPDLQLLFQDAEIIGNAVDPEDAYWNYAFVPMDRMPGHENRWTLVTGLHPGELKFRTRNSWDENWGGRTFPSGQLSWFGDNIVVPDAGRYRITLDLAEETYAFERLED